MTLAEKEALVKKCIGKKCRIPQVPAPGTTLIPQQEYTIRSYSMTPTMILLLFEEVERMMINAEIAQVYNKDTKQYEDIY